MFFMHILTTCTSLEYVSLVIDQLLANVRISDWTYIVLLELVLVSLTWTLIIYHLLYFFPSIGLAVAYFSKTLGV